MAEMLKRQDKEGGRTRHWRSNFKRLQRELLQLEEDEQVLDSVFPQVRTAKVTKNLEGPAVCSLAGLLSVVVQPHRGDVSTCKATATFALAGHLALIGSMHVCCPVYVLPTGS